MTTNRMRLGRMPHIRMALGEWQPSERPKADRYLVECLTAEW